MTQTLTNDSRLKLAAEVGIQEIIIPVWSKEDVKKQLSHKLDVNLPVSVWFVDVYRRIE